MKINTKNIMQNKFVLYLVFFLSLVTVFGYITSENYQSVLLFVLIGLLTNYFSKNMIVILGAAIIGTLIVSFVNGSFVFNNNVVEGFGHTDEKDTHDGNKTSNGTKEDFTNQALSPAALDNVPNLDSLNNLFAKTDQGKKKEKAYDLLESAMNNDSIKGVAGETKNLLNKQVQLMDQMKKITPILQQTMGLVNNLDLGALTNIAKQVTDVMPENLDNLISLSNKVSE